MSVVVSWWSISQTRGTWAGAVSSPRSSRNCTGRMLPSPCFDAIPRTIGREQEVGLVLPPAPPDLVDLLFDFERFEVVELWLVRLELGVELVLARLLLALVALKEDDAPSLVARG